MKSQNKDTGDTVNGVPFHLLDGYDGGDAPPPDYIAKMLAGAPPEIQARAKQYAAEQKATEVDNND